MDSSTSKRGTDVAERADVLLKAAHMLAFEVSAGGMTVTGRKLYNLMLWHAQRMRPVQDESGHLWFRAPIVELIQGRGLASASATSRLLRYIQEMDSVRVVWRALTAGEQKHLDGFEPPARAEEPAVQTRFFGLFSEARVEVIRGQGWVQWCYPPSVHAMLMQPERWAQLRLESIVQLSTYAAVALYEICARYRDVPGGLTTRHPPEFWTGVLREAADLQPRPWRKIKYELVQPAVQQITERTELEVELIEHTGRGAQSRTIVEVQFRVARKARSASVSVAAPQPQAEDVTLVMRAASMGVREQDLDALVAQYSASSVDRAMDALEGQLADPANVIKNRVGYLRAILANSHPGGQVEQPLSKGELASVQSAPVQVVEQGEVPEVLDAGAPTSAELVSERRRQAQLVFERLSAEQRSEWIRRTLETPGATLPQFRRRLEAGHWDSPLVRSMVLDVFIAGGGDSPQ